MRRKRHLAGVDCHSPIRLPSSLFVDLHLSKALALLKHAVVIPVVLYKTVTDLKRLSARPAPS